MACIWEEYEEVMLRVRQQVGFTLHKRKSAIEHPEAGLGVFVSNEKVLLPGTLVGFVPGVIATKSGIAKDTTIPERGELPYILRFDGTAVNYEDSLVYPWHASGRTIMETTDLVAKYTSEVPMEVPGEAINPFALGHVINHPPSGRPANVCFLEMEVPVSFFPKFFMRYFPYMHYSHNEYSIIPAPKRLYKVIAVVALEAIGNGEELYVNYG